MFKALFSSGLGVAYRHVAVLPRVGETIQIAEWSGQGEVTAVNWVEAEVDTASVTGVRALTPEITVVYP